MKAIAMGGQQVATVVGDSVVDVANAIRSAEKQSLLEAAQGAMQPHALRLKQVTGRIGADTMQWMHQGGLWRSILVMAVSILYLVQKRLTSVYPYSQSSFMGMSAGNSKEGKIMGTIANQYLPRHYCGSVGGVSVTTLAGLTAFLMAGLVTTVNAVVIAFLMCLTAAGAFLAMFCTSLTCIYIGGLAATAIAIGSAVVMASSVVLFFAGWILFGWAIWEVMNKSLNIVRGVFFWGGSVSVSRAPRHPHLRERGPSPLGGFATQNG